MRCSCAHGCVASVPALCRAVNALFGHAIIMPCLQYAFFDVSVYETTCHQWLQSPNVCRRSKNVLELKAHFAKGEVTDKKVLRVTQRIGTLLRNVVLCGIPAV